MNKLMFEMMVVEYISEITTLSGVIKAERKFKKNHQRRLITAEDYTDVTYMLENKEAELISLLTRESAVDSICGFNIIEHDLDICAEMFARIHSYHKRHAIPPAVWEYAIKELSNIMSSINVVSY